jgi:hypothetical protein
MVNHKNHSDPQTPMGVTIPVPVRVQCSQVQVQVDKKKPEGHLCHALSFPDTQFELMKIRYKK